jgi:orotidine-5'-phosphate decarboxylase
MTRDPAADRLIVALDVDADRFDPLLDALEAVPTLKVGMEAYYRHGAEVVHRLRDRGHEVFLDLKLHDIPTTVERASRVVAGLGVRYLTVHASGGPEMMAAAIRGVSGSVTRILAVTLLTSLRGDELPGVWDPATSADEKVEILARMAGDAGCYGVVASAREAAPLRRRLGPTLALVCPGIRSSGADPGDQQRTATPGDAIRDGADHLVVGRPVTAAADPARAAAAIVAEIRAALRTGAPAAGRTPGGGFHWPG